MTEQEIEQLNSLSMNILIHAGNGRENNMKAIEALSEFNFSDAEYFFGLANDEIVTAHRMQTSTLQKEAEGEIVTYSILFSHAQDTLMNIQSELLLTRKLKAIFMSLDKRINKIEEEMK